MKAFFTRVTALSIVLLFTLSLQSCGKKDATTTDTKSAETKKDGSTSSGDNIDGMINDYEVLMKEYVVIVQKVKKGEMDQTAKMQELSNKTQEWSRKLTEVAPKLTPEQSKRIADISKMGAEQMGK